MRAGVTGNVRINTKRYALSRVRRGLRQNNNPETQDLVKCALIISNFVLHQRFRVTLTPVNLRR